ncbi:MAG TPA: hypothetical protein VMV02_00785 [Acidimicrobiales bacterium]|nr:hypothetical protein [Acidimicrobiales bacterium]
MVAPLGRMQRHRARFAAAGALLCALLVVGVVPVGAAAQGHASAGHGTSGGRLGVPTDSPFPPFFPGVFDDSTVPTFPDGTAVGAIGRWVAAALGARADRLNQLGNEVTAANNLSTAAQTTLQDLLAADAAGIATLQAEASGGAGLSTLEGVASSMVLSYRVFAVVTPLVRDSIELSNQIQRTTSLQSGEAALEAAITTGFQSGSASASAQGIYRDLVNQLAPVVGTDQTQLAAVLAMHPASYTPSEATISTAEAAISDGWNRVRTAVADERRIVRLLAAPGLSSNHRILRLLRTLLK